ncbi:MAG: 50S ribosomal protein L10 [Bacteroidota bacterium]|nr:50S ribosomal protein L10 [Bacteroidota bacterium]
MNKSEKELIVTEIQEKVSKAQGMFFTDFAGINVEQMTELRREFRKSGIEYKVVKNTLAKKALQNVSGYDKVYDKLVGSTGIAFAYNDPAAPAKIIQKFKEKNEKFSLKVCVIEKQVYEGSRLKELASMPSRAEIVAGILGSLNSPITGIVGTINAVIRDVVGVLGAIEKKKAA